MNNYSVRQVKASFGGVSIDSGRGDGSFIKIEKIEEGHFKIKQGVDGTVTRYECSKDACKVTLILMQGSETNDFLSSVFNGDVLLENGSGIGPLKIEDMLGTSRFFDLESCISDLPNEEYAEEPGTVEWVFFSPNPVRNVGSN